MRKIVTIIISLFLLSLVLPFNIEAKSLTSAKVKFRRDRRAIIVTFGSLGSISNLTYMLSYQTSKGVPQGASGTIMPTSEETITRELLFGTCSHGVCRYDKGVKNAKFVVTTNFKNGKRAIKTFRLKV